MSHYTLHARVHLKIHDAAFFSFNHEEKKKATKQLVKEG